MKKILYTISIFLLGLVLIACDNSASGVPTVNEKNKVELTSQEVSDLLSNIELDDVSLKLTSEVNVKGKAEGKDILIDAKATVYGNSKGEVNASVNAKINVPDVNVEGKGNLYVVSGDKKVYLDVDASVKVNIFGLETDTSIEGKYFLPFDLEDLDDFGGLDDLLPISIDLNIEEILKELQNQENLEEIMSYSGLTFYKKGNDVSIKFEINKELIKENEDLFGDFDNFLDIEQADLFEFVLVVVIKNNKLKEAGASLVLKGGEDKKIDYADIKASVHLSFGVKMPKLPNFDSYIEFDPEDLFGGFLQ